MNELIQLIESDELTVTRKSLIRQNIHMTQTRIVFCLDYSSLFEWINDDIYINLEPITTNNFMTYIKNAVENKCRYCGDTYCASVINVVINKYGKENRPNASTVFVLVSDQNNYNKRSSQDIFWKFVAVGYLRFSEKLDNTPDIVDDEILYQTLLNKYNDWITACLKKGII